MSCVVNWIGRGRSSTGSSGRVDAEVELESDLPLESFSEESDVLGTDRLAESLAPLLLLRKPESLVLAIEGSWGAGKTTLANVLENRVRAPDRRPKPAIVKFGAWLFSERGALLADFFRELQSSVGFHEGKLDDAVRRLMEFGLMFTAKSRTPKLFAPDEARQVWRVKQRVAAALRRCNRRILVFVDDIDRLTKSETRLLFWLLKTVADLPSIYYILMYDRDVVVRALNGYFPGRGEEYLARIVQVRVPLPLPTRETVKGFLARLLSRVAGVPEANAVAIICPVWQAGLDSLVPTLRHAKLLANALGVGQKFGHDICAPCVAAESLRVFIPSAYTYVRQNLETFLTNPSTHIPYGDIRVPLSKAAVAEQLLNIIFPPRVAGKALDATAVHKYFYVG